MDSTQKNAAHQFMEQFKETDYPPEFLADYTQLECLSQGEGVETFLVQDKISGDRKIAKCYDTEAYTTTPKEMEWLRQLNHKGLPEAVRQYQSPQMLCVVRDYVEGTALSKLDLPLDKDKALNYLLQLCDILEYLHSQSPPVIHRDVKPSNLIVDNNDTIHLIDFEIARSYKEGADKDTEYQGTREYAAPEQFGYRQTDARTDLYAVGVLLACLLTGSPSLENLSGRIGDRDMVQLVRKLTAFEPDKRFSSAAELRNALSQTQKAPSRRGRKTGILVAAVLLLVCIGVFIYRDAAVYDGPLDMVDSLTIPLDAQPVAATRGNIAPLLHTNGAYRPVVNPGGTFHDVPPGHPYIEDINAIVERGIINGYPGQNENEPNSFRPDELLPAGFYTFIVLNRICLFDDVKWEPDNYEVTYPALCRRAYEYGILTEEQLRQAEEEPGEPIVLMVESVLVPLAESDARIVWSSSDESIATVEGGQVFPVSKGTVTITATAGKSKADCVVTVE